MGRSLPVFGMRDDQGHFTTSKRTWANQLQLQSEIGGIEDMPWPDNKRKIFMRHPLIELLDKYNKYLKALTRFNKYSYMSKQERIEYLKFNSKVSKDRKNLRAVYYQEGPVSHDLRERMANRDFVAPDPARAAAPRRRATHHYGREKLEKCSWRALPALKIGGGRRAGRGEAREGRLFRRGDDDDGDGGGKKKKKKTWGPSTVPRRATDGPKKHVASKASSLAASVSMSSRKLGKSDPKRSWKDVPKFPGRVLKKSGKLGKSLSESALLKKGYVPIAQYKALEERYGKLNYMFEEGKKVAAGLVERLQNELAQIRQWTKEKIARHKSRVQDLEN